MIYLFRKTVFDCKQATLLSIKRAEGKITLLERAKLSYHLFYCETCRRFVNQWGQLDLRGREFNRVIETRPPFVLSEAAKDRMQKMIETL